MYCRHGTVSRGGPPEKSYLVTAEQCDGGKTETNMQIAVLHVRYGTRYCRVEGSPRGPWGGSGDDKAEGKL